MHRFMVRPEVFYADGALHCLNMPDINRVLLIIDPFLKQGGAGDLVEGVFPPSTEFLYYTNIRPDPSIELLGDGVREALDCKPDLIVALGGGSTIDAAKAIVYLYNTIRSSQEPGFARTKFAIIPTTSGTGSEVTNVSVITVDGRKLVLVNDAFLPDMAVIDVTFTKSLPLPVLADTSIDALTHAIEAYLSKNNSDCTDALAEKAIQLIFTYLPQIFTQGDSLEARQRLHNASCIAGMAFTNASLGINHSMAHAVGAMFHIPHGKANAVFLPVTIGYNAQVEYVQEKLEALCRILGLPASGKAACKYAIVSAIEQLLRTCNMPVSVSELSIDMAEYQGAVPKMAQLALEDRCTPTNAKAVSQSDLERLFRNV